MTTKPFPVSTSAERTPQEKLPPLEPGDHLNQKTFHERYEEKRGGEKGTRLVFTPHPLVLSWDDREAAS